MSIKKSRIFWIFLACNLLVFSYSEAQSNDVIAKYRIAKEQYLSSKYTECILIFSDLVRNYSSHELAPSFYFYLASSYFNLGNYKDANFIFFQIINKYPNWPDISLAYYYKAVVQLRMGNVTDALTQFSKITQPEVQNMALQAKAAHFQQTSTDSIRYFSMRFPNDTYLKELLRSKTEPVITNTSLKIAVLLPFESQAKNGFVYDLFNGITLAVDSLQKAGISVQLSLVDTGKDTLKLLQFTSDSMAANFDLIIGPIYAFQQTIISRFSQKTGVPVVNPLSNNAYHSLFNTGYYLWKPGYETIGRSAARFSFENFKRKNNVAIVYGSELGDSLMAKAYRSEYENLGGNVLLFKKLPKEISNYFGPIMTKVFPVIDTLGHLFIAANDAVLAANVFTYLETVLVDKASTYKDMRTDEEKKKEEEDRKKKELLFGPKLSTKDIPIIAPASWLDFTSISYDQFSLHETHFVHPDFIMKDSVPNSNFYTNYVDKTGIAPSIYAYNGYELMLYFGMQLSRYSRNQLYKIKEASYTKNYGSSYIWYRNQNDNSFVPIVKIVDYKLQLTNPIKP